MFDGKKDMDEMYTVRAISGGTSPAMITAGKHLFSIVPYDPELQELSRKNNLRKKKKTSVYNKKKKQRKKSKISRRKNRK